MRFIAIDWSGAKKRPQKKIWLSEVVDGQMTRLENGRNREEVAEHLIEEALGDPRLVVGLDFAFSLPSWFLAERGLTTARELWECLEREGETWLHDCDYPFWGRPGRRKPKLPAEFRQTEQTAPSIAGIQPKSVFQIGGAGAVGTGSLRGMPILRQLQDAGFAIWPFDPPSPPVVIEIYPRLLTGAVSKTRHDARTDYLGRHHPDLTAEHHELAAGSEDAFDAAVSALIMSSHSAELLALPEVKDLPELTEGRIWWPDKKHR